MTKRYDTYPATEYDGLIYDINPPADVFTVKIRKQSSDATTLKRGTVLALSTGTADDNLMVMLGTTAATNETLTANCILAEDVEVGTTEDAVALAYRTGHFASNKLIVASGKTFGAADKEALRDVGILISEAM